MKIDDLIKNSGIPKPMHITVRYDSKLEKITKCKEEPVYMGEGGNFGYLLYNVILSHPEIEKKYKPGVLGFSINGTPPKTYTPLFDGDVVFFSVIS